MVGMAHCAVPAREVAGGTHVPATAAFEAVAPPHAARTSQRDVPTTLTVLYRSKDRQMSRVFTNRSQLVGLRRSFVVQIQRFIAGIRVGSLEVPQGRKYARSDEPESGIPVVPPGLDRSWLPRPSD